MTEEIQIVLPLKRASLEDITEASASGNRVKLGAIYFIAKEEIFPEAFAGPYLIDQSLVDSGHLRYLYKNNVLWVPINSADFRIWNPSPLAELHQP